MDGECMFTYLKFPRPRTSSLALGGSAPLNQFRGEGDFCIVACRVQVGWVPGYFEKAIYYQRATEGENYLSYSFRWMQQRRGAKVRAAVLYIPPVLCDLAMSLREIYKLIVIDCYPTAAAPLDSYA